MNQLRLLEICYIPILLRSSLKKTRHIININFVGSVQILRRDKRFIPNQELDGLPF